MIAISSQRVVAAAAGCSIVETAQVNGKVIDKAHMLNPELRGCPVFDRHLVFNRIAFGFRLKLDHQISARHRYNEVRNINIGAELQGIIAAIDRSSDTAVAGSCFINPGHPPAFARAHWSLHCRCIAIRFLHAFMSRFINGVMAVATVEDVNVVTATTLEQIVALAAVENIFAATAVKRVVARASQQVIVTVSALQSIATIAAEQVIIALAAVQDIITSTTNQIVIPGKACQNVVATAARKNIAACCAIQPVVALIARAGVGDLGHVQCHARRKFKRLDPIVRVRPLANGQVIIERRQGCVRIIQVTHADEQTRPTGLKEQMFKPDGKAELQRIIAAIHLDATGPRSGPVLGHPATALAAALIAIARKISPLIGLGFKLLVKNHISAIATEIDIGVVATAAFQIVTASPAQQNVVTIAAVQPVIARFAGKHIIAIAAIQPIAAIATEEVVIAILTKQPVVVGIAKQKVFVSTALQPVGASPASDDIAARLAVEPIIAVAAREEVTFVGAHQIIVIAQPVLAVQDPAKVELGAVSKSKSFNPVFLICPVGNRDLIVRDDVGILGVAQCHDHVVARAEQDEVRQRNPKAELQRINAAIDLAKYFADTDAVFIAIARLCAITSAGFIDPAGAFAGLTAHPRAVAIGDPLLIGDLFLIAKFFQISVFGKIMDAVGTVATVVVVSIVASRTVQRIRAFAANDQVVAAPAIDAVVTSLTKQPVVAIITAQRVIASFTGKQITATAAAQVIITVAAHKDVIDIVACAADLVGSIAGAHRLNIHGIDVDRQARRFGHDDLIIAFAAINIARRRKVGRINKQNVTAGTTDQRIGTLATDQEVAASTPDQAIVTRTAIEQHGLRLGRGIDDIGERIALCADPPGGIIAQVDIALVICEPLELLDITIFEFINQVAVLILIGTEAERMVRQGDVGAVGDRAIGAVHIDQPVDHRAVRQDRASILAGFEPDRLDPHFAQRRHFSIVNQAVAVAVLPELELIPARVTAVQQLVLIAVEMRRQCLQVGVIRLRPFGKGDFPRLGHPVVIVKVKHQQPVVAGGPGGPLQIAVVVEVKIGGALAQLGQLNAITIQIDNHRLAGLGVVIAV